MCLFDDFLRIGMPWDSSTINWTIYHLGEDFWDVWIWTVLSRNSPLKGKKKRTPLSLKRPDVGRLRSRWMKMYWVDIFKIWIQWKIRTKALLSVLFVWEKNGCDVRSLKNQRLGLARSFSTRWFQISFIFIPIWGNDPIWRAYFSDGLKLPTSFIHLGKDSELSKLVFCWDVFVRIALFFCLFAFKQI